jgi:hypothetical protein
MVELDAKYRSKGLHIVTAYTQFQDLEVIESKVNELGIKFPVALDGFFESRFTAPLICRVWVIGVDGKVVHAHKLGWEEAALKELKKLKYPMLRRDKVHDDVKQAARAFAEGRYAEAHKLATKVSDGDFPDAAIDDADSITDRVEDMARTLSRRADVHEICGRYELALACWAELAEHFKGLEDLRDPAKEAARIKGLKTYKPEMKARREYVATRLKAWHLFSGLLEEDKAAILKAAQDASAMLHKFAKEHAKATVSDSAKDLAAAYDAWVKRMKQETK